MVSIKSVFVAALAASSVSAYSGRYHRRNNGHSHGGNLPSIPRGGFSNSTIPAVPVTTTTPTSIPIETGVPDVVTPINNTTVTQTATKEVYTTVTVSYTLGNGKVVTTAFTKVRQPTTSSASTTKVTQTVVPVGTPVSDVKAGAGTPAPVAPVGEENPESVYTTSTTTTTVYTTVTARRSSSTSFGGLNNDFITKKPTPTGAPGASECANAPATVTETVKVPVQVVTVTSVSVSVSYVTVPAASAPTSSATFVEVPQPTQSSVDTSAPVATPVETETQAPSLPTVVPPFVNGTAPFYPNGTHPTNGTQTVTRVTATVIPVQTATLI